MSSTTIRPYVLTICSQESARVPSFTNERILMPAYDAADAQAQWKCTRFGSYGPLRSEPLDRLESCRPLDPDDPAHAELAKAWTYARLRR